MDWAVSAERVPTGARAALPVRGSGDASAGAVGAIAAFDLSPASGSDPLADPVDPAQPSCAARPQEGERRSVLLLGNYRPALTAARTLAAAGYRVIVGLGGEGGCEHSGAVAEVWDHPLPVNRKAFLDALARLISRRADIGFVLPIAEEYVLLLAETGLVRLQGAAIVSPAPQTVLAFADKTSALRRATELGVACLPFRLVTDHPELLTAAEAIGFPLTIRPHGATARIAGKKALILREPAELRRALPDWPRGHDRLLLQQYAVGERRNLYFAARNGRLLGFVETRILRTDQPDATGLAVEGETVAPSPGIVHDTAKLVRSCDYTGIGLTQFIVNPATGERCFLELNARVSGSHAVPEAFGLPLTRLAVELAAGAAVSKELPAAYASGKRYVWTFGDVRGLAFAWKSREIGVAAALAWAGKLAIAAARADLHMTWRWTDPVPTLAMFTRSFPLWRSVRFRQAPGHMRSCGRPSP